MNKITLILPLLFSCVCCGKYKIAKGTPECVENKIEVFDEQIDCDENVNVKEYTFQGGTVYVFDPGTCGADMTSEVIDSECKTLGYLGGIAGNTEINGEDFSKADYKKTVWEK